MAKNSTVDQGEVWAAVLGVQPVLSKEVERVTADQRKRVLNWSTTVAKHAARLVQGQIEAEYPDVPEYDWLDTACTNGFDVDQVQAMIARLPDDDQLPYMGCANRQMEFVSQAFPRASFQTLTGYVPLPPDPMLWFRFLGLYRVINDPLNAFGLICSGALLQNQAAALRAVYPTITAQFDNAIRAALVDAVAKKPKYVVPWRTDAGIRDWLGMPDPYKPYQAAFVAGAEQPGREPEPSSASVSPEAKASLSAAQSALYGQVGR